MMKQGLTATMGYFNLDSSLGMVRLSDGRSIFCYWDAIQGLDYNDGMGLTEADKFKLRGVTGKRCLVDVKETASGPEIELCFIPGLES